MSTELANCGSDIAACPLCQQPMTWIDEPELPKQHDWCNECRDDIARLLDEDNTPIATSFRVALMDCAGAVLRNAARAMRTDETDEAHQEKE